MSELNLERVDLSDGLVSGIDVAYNSKAGHQVYGPPPAGKDGWHFVGKGHDKTIVHSTGADASIAVGREARHVRFSDMTVKNALSKAVFIGTDVHNKPDSLPLSWHANDVVFDGREGGRWPVFVNGGDEKLEGCVIYGREQHGRGEHDRYGHGVYKDGVAWNYVQCYAAAVEQFKATMRPQARYYKDPALLAQAKHAYTDGYHPAGKVEDEGPVYDIRNCYFEGFGGNGKGGGVVFQGCAGRIRLWDTIVWQKTTNRVGLCFAVDDSGVEHFGVADDGKSWEGGRDPAGGFSADIQRCGFFGSNGPSWTSPMIRFGSLRMGFNGELMKWAKLQHCAIYGLNRTVMADQIPQFQVEGCNLPAIERFARSLGYDTRHEAIIDTPTGFFPVSAGFKGSTMAVPVKA